MWSLILLEKNGKQSNFLLCLCLDRFVTGIGYCSSTYAIHDYSGIILPIYIYIDGYLKKKKKTEVFYVTVLLFLQIVNRALEDKLWYIERSFHS